MKCTTNKIRYSTRFSAWKRALLFSVKYIKQSPYKCSICKGFHLSTKTRTTGSNKPSIELAKRLNKWKIKHGFE